MIIFFTLCTQFMKFIKLRIMLEIIIDLKFYQIYGHFLIIYDEKMNTCVQKLKKIFVRVVAH